MTDRETTKVVHRAIRKGGLMRCCIQTIERIDYHTTHGDIIACVYCGTFSMVGADGCWRWAPELPKVKAQDS